MYKTPLCSAAAVAALLNTLAVHADDEAAPRAGATLSPVVVTADPRGDRSADELVQPIHVLAGDALELRQAGTLGEVLDGLPGVANADFGPGVGRPVIRGLQGSRVEVLENGLSVADISGEGADHALGIDTAHAEQIEVFRGPATLLYGSGAAGGVINVRTGRFSPLFGDSLVSSGALSYGENGDDRRGHLALEAPLSEQFVLRAAGSLRHTHDFSIDGFQGVDQTESNRGRLRNSSIETDSYSATGLFRGDRGHIGLGFSRWETDYGVPENFDPRPLDMGGQGDEVERILAEYDRVDLRAVLEEPLPGFELLRAKMAYTEFSQQEVGFEFERTGEGAVLDEREVEAGFDNDEFETRLEMVHKPLGNWSGVIGLQHRDRDFLAEAEGDDNFYVRPNRTRSTALFVLEELPTAFGRLELGARVERERSDPDAVPLSAIDGITLADGSFLPFPRQVSARSFTPVSVSAGTIVELDRTRHLRGTLTHAERAPSPEQLWAFGRHAAAGTFEIGDPSLDKERYLNLDIGIDRHAGRLSYDFTIFYNRVNDFIFLESEDDGSGDPVFVNDLGDRAGEGTAADCEPGEGGLCELGNQLVFNRQVDAEFYGAEFAAAVDLAAGPLPVTLRVSGDHVRGKLRDSGNLPRITPTRLGVGVNSYWKNLDFRVDYRRVFKQDDTAATEDETRGFNLVSFDLVWQPEGLRETRFFLQGRNLLDEDGRLHQSFFKDEAPIIGRAFIAGVRFELGR